jgi:hypothetical protein
MSSLIRLFGTSLENAATQPERLFKSHPQTAPVVVTKTRIDENRTATSEEPVTRAIHRRKRSATAVPSTLFALQESEEESNTDVEPPRRTLSDRERSGKKRIQTFDDSSSNDVIYSTSSSLDSTSSSESCSSTSDSTGPLSPDSSALFEEAEPVPICMLSTNERTAIIGAGSWFSEDDEDVVTDSRALSTNPLCWNSSLTTQVSLTRSTKPEIKVDVLDQLLGLEGSRRRSYPQLIKRKPVPTRLLKDISREMLMAKLVATRPVTPSLLSFTEFTSPSARRRVHTARVMRSRYGPPDSDALRRNCVERYRLLRSGVSFDAPSSPGPKPFLFPRAGDLSQLRSLDSTAFVDDWHLGYVDLSFIQKTLFAFDMRMRVGCDLWAAEEDEIYRLFGDTKEWERDWDMRWRIASWLLNQSDEEDLEEEDARSS